MPRGDGTGPEGIGPMTGRGSGHCAGFITSGYTSPSPRLGLAFRRGSGRGRGKGLSRKIRRQIPVQVQPTQQPQEYVQSSREEGIQRLKKQLEALESQLDQVRTSINKLKD